MEGAWLSAELVGFAALRPWLATLPYGDGHPVLVLPGFTGGDESTVALRIVLREHGYWAHRWRQGRNLGPTRRNVDGMRHRLEELHHRHGRRVSLVGQSLGGVYARALARERPDLVRQVISLGSPYRMVDGNRSAARHTWDRVGHRHDCELAYAGLLEQDRPPLQVPATSVYSRTDGVAAWHTCIDAPGELCENIEVHGSHIGMCINPAVVIAVLDRLSEREGQWHPFVPPAGLRSWYPRAKRWHPERPRRDA